MKETLSNIVELEHFYITMPDDTRLAARAWMPADAQDVPVPAIVEYLPYRKRDQTAPRDEVNHQWFAENGYAGIRVDIRGNGESDGLMLDEYTIQELDDGKCVIAWLAEQDWCDGNVGMIGISWGGFNGLQIAELQPPALKAVITVCSTDDRYADDIHFAGGCMLTDNLTWSAQMMGYTSRPPDPQLREDWREIWRYRLENLPFLAANWISHQQRDEFWRHASVCENYSAIKAAVFAVGGWYDLYSNAIPRLLKGLESPSLGLVGPWVHRYPHQAYPEPSMDFLSEALRFWDYWLKGIDTGIMNEPRLRAYIHDAVTPQADYEFMPGRFTGEHEWPTDNIEQTQWFLNSSGIDKNPVESEPILINSPVDVGLASGRTCPGMRLGLEHPLDQRVDDAKSQCFDSEVLDETIEILGTTYVELILSSNQPRAMVAVRLCDVHPDGSSFRVTYGLLNINQRETHDKDTELIPGQRYTIKIKLNDMGYRFAPGHKIRIAISTSYWPIAWPLPIPATLSIYPGISKLFLPVRKNCTKEIEFPRSSSGVKMTEFMQIHTQPEHSRTITKDVGTGETVMETYDDMGSKTISSCGITMASNVRERYSIHMSDPLSARLDIEWNYDHGRQDDFSTRIVSRQRQWSDEENFHLEAELIAYDADEEFFRKQWNQTFPRTV